MAQEPISRRHRRGRSCRIELVPVEAQHTQTTTAQSSGVSRDVVRTEQTLVLGYTAFMESKGSVIKRFRVLPPGERAAILSDLYDATRNNLVEAKGTAKRDAVRMAVGQIADYRRFATDPGVAVLLPSKPRDDLEQLLSSQGIHAIWKTSDGFTDNASGRFT
jgi:hypothetical protein